MGVRKIENTEMRLNLVSIIHLCFVGDRVSLDSAGYLGARAFPASASTPVSGAMGTRRWHLVMVPEDGADRERAVVRKRTSTVEGRNCLPG